MISYRLEAMILSRENLSLKKSKANVTKAINLIKFHSFPIFHANFNLLLKKRNWIWSILLNPIRGLGKELIILSARSASTSLLTQRSAKAATQSSAVFASKSVREIGVPKSAKTITRLHGPA